MDELTLCILIFCVAICAIFGADVKVIVAIFLIIIICREYARQDEDDDSSEVEYIYELV